MFIALTSIFYSTMHQLNECYIDKQVAYFTSIWAIDDYTRRDYKIYDWFLDVAWKSFHEALSSPEKCTFCFRCDENNENCHYYNYTPEERRDLLIEAVHNYIIYSFRTMKKILPCPIKNDYYFDYR